MWAVILAATDAELARSGLAALVFGLGGLSYSWWLVRNDAVPTRFEARWIRIGRVVYVPLALAGAIALLVAGARSLLG